VAVRNHAGANAAIQHCQVHKRRNVLDHLDQDAQPGVARKLNEACALEDYAAARQALERLRGELMETNPSAARSLEAGMEETLTVHRLRVPPLLCRTLASTNVIESAFSVVERVCSNVKGSHGGDQRERWVGSGLLVAERQFHKLKGHKLIPSLLRELESLCPDPLPPRRLRNHGRRRRMDRRGLLTSNDDPGNPLRAGIGTQSATPEVHDLI
jgi:hypothetical protein